MKLRIHHIILLFLLLLLQNLKGQDTTGNLLPVTTDTIANSLSFPKQSTFPTDSVSKRPNMDSINRKSVKEITTEQLTDLIYKENPFFGFESVSRQAIIAEREWEWKEPWFYSIVGLLFMVGLFRSGFEKYLHDLFRLFFNTTMKQRQIREQMIQTPLASALLNVFFVLSSSFFISFLLQYYQVIEPEQFWLIFLYAILFIAAIYLVKFIWLKLAGWLFNVQEAADNYIFIVFIINKIIGIFLLPILILMAFANEDILQVALVISWIGLAGLLIYRFILTFAAVRNQINVNLFHFFVYLCAFEIAPLLLIYKGLILFFERT